MGYRNPATITNGVNNYNDILKATHNGKELWLASKYGTQAKQTKRHGLERLVAGDWMQFTRDKKTATRWLTRLR